jgi:hypothetical protein
MLFQICIYVHGAKGVGAIGGRGAKSRCGFGSGPGSTKIIQLIVVLASVTEGQY